MRAGSLSAGGRRVAGLVVATLVFTAGLSSTRGAVAEVTFDATAAGYGFDLVILNESLPIGLVPQVAGPTAQSALSSLPQSRSFASFPFPGETVVALPGLASGLVSGVVSLPEYPFIADASLGEPPAEVNQPGIGLRVVADEQRSEARADVGSDAIGFVAQSLVQTSGDRVQAEAETELRGLSLGQLGSISGIRASASATMDSSGNVELDHSLELAALRFPGLELTIPKETPTQIPLPNPISGFPQLPPIEFPAIPLPLGGTTLIAPELGFRDGQFFVSLPLLGSASFAVPTEAVLDALAALGIRMSYQAPQETDTSIVGAVLSIETTLPAPPPGNPLGITGESTVRIDLGRVTASISGTPIPDPDVPPLDGGGGGFDASFDSPSFGSGEVSFPAPSAGGGAPVARPAAPELAATPIAIDRGDAMPLYLLLLAAGIVGTATTQSLRYLGVRHRWTS